MPAHPVTSVQQIDMCKKRRGEFFKYFGYQNNLLLSDFRSFFGLALELNICLLASHLVGAGVRNCLPGQLEGLARLQVIKYIGNRPRKWLI